MTASLVRIRRSRGVESKEPPHQEDHVLHTPNVTPGSSPHPDDASRLYQRGLASTGEPPDQGRRGGAAQTHAPHRRAGGRRRRLVGPPELTSYDHGPANEEPVTARDFATFAVAGVLAGAPELTGPAVAPHAGALLPAGAVSPIASWLEYPTDPGISRPLSTFVRPYHVEHVDPYADTDRREGRTDANWLWVGRAGGDA